VSGLRWIVIGGAAILLAACGGIPQAVIGVDGDGVGARRVPGAAFHRIFVAGTRANATDSPARLYTGARNKALQFARIDMAIPPSHTIGTVERAKSLPPDPRKHIVALDPLVLNDGKGFVAAINRALASRKPADRSVLIFIHGYNTSFDAALFRFAQFVHDTGFAGVPVLFTWPSGGGVLDYVYDINSVLGSRDALLETFRLLATTPLRQADIVAHSMGNFLALETLRQAAVDPHLSRDKRLRYVVMAAPDIDIDVFETQVRALPGVLRKFYVLLSEDDRALAISRRIAGRVNRVGNSPEIERLEKIGVNVVDLTKVDVQGNLNHSKFAEAPFIVKMIGDRLRADAGGLTTETSQPVGDRIVQGVIDTATAIPRSVLPTDTRVYTSP